MTAADRFAAVTQPRPPMPPRPDVAEATLPRLSLTVPAALYERLRRHAARLELSYTDVLRAAWAASATPPPAQQPTRTPGALRPVAGATPSGRRQRIRARTVAVRLHHDELAVLDAAVAAGVGAHRSEVVSRVLDGWLPRR